MHVERVAQAGIAGRNGEGLTLHRKRQVTDEGVVEDAIDRGPVEHATLGQAAEAGAGGDRQRGRRGVGHGFTIGLVWTDEKSHFRYIRAVHFLAGLKPLPTYDFGDARPPYGLVT